MSSYAFATMTGQVIFDYARCQQCQEKPCIDSCPAGILQLRDGMPALAKDEEEVKKGKCIECLACELACQFHGAGGLKIELPIPGLAELRGLK